MHSDRPSLTAQRIARGILYLAADEGVAALLPPSCVEATERLLAAAGLITPRQVSLIRKPWLVRIFGSIERLTTPGVGLKIAVRKRFLDDETRRAISDGATQVLVVGAGFDTLCQRLALEFPNVQFVEVDHPGTHGVKRMAVEKTGAAAPNLHLLAADLAAESLADALSRSPWQSDAPSVVVAEGVLMYLDASAISALLTAVKDNTSPGSRLLFTYMQPDAKGRPWAGSFSSLTRTTLRLLGEPWRWAIRRDEAPEFFKRHGYLYDESPELYDFRRRYLEPAGLADRALAEIELVALARTV